VPITQDLLLDVDYKGVFYYFDTVLT